MNGRALVTRLETKGISQDPTGCMSWAFVLVDEVICILEASHDIEHVTDGDRDGSDWFTDFPPEPGLWYWEGYVKQESGPFEYPEEGDYFLVTKRWCRAQVADLLLCQAPAVATE